MPQKPLPLIISLKDWREQNGFSQSDAGKESHIALISKMDRFAKAKAHTTLDLALTSIVLGRLSPATTLAQKRSVIRPERTLIGPLSVL